MLQTTTEGKVTSDNGTVAESTAVEIWKKYVKMYFLDKIDQEMNAGLLVA